MASSADARLQSMMFCHVDPDVVGFMEEPPAHVTAEFNDVFSYANQSTGPGNLKLRMHPILKRWAIYENIGTYQGQADMHQVVWVCSETPTGEPAEDFEGEPLLEKFAGEIGGYRLPNKADFAEVAKFDYRRHGSKSIADYQDKNTDREDKETEDLINDFEGDFVDYHAHLAMKEEGHLDWLPTTHYDDVAKQAESSIYEREWRSTGPGEKDGYWVRTKKEG